MKLNKYLIATLVLCSLFLFAVMGLVSANLGTFTQGSCVNIRVIANCSNINLTEVTSLNTQYSINSKMTNIGGQTFNYSFCNTSDLGMYSYSWNNFCIDCSQGNCGNSFEITPTGIMQTPAQGIGSAMYLLLILVLTFTFGYLGVILYRHDNAWIFGIFFIFLSILFLTYDVWLGLEFHKTFTGLSDSTMPATIFWIFLFLLVAGFLSMLALVFLNWRDFIKKFKKAFKNKGDLQDEDFDDWDESKFK